MAKPAKSNGADVKGAFVRLDEIASGGGAQARFWRVYGRYMATRARGEILARGEVGESSPGKATTQEGGSVPQRQSPWELSSAFCVLTEPGSAGTPDSENGPIRR